MYRSTYINIFIKNRLKLHKFGLFNCYNFKFSFLFLSFNLKKKHLKYIE